MTGLNHGMTGAVIALAVKNPAAAVPLAFISHFAQDALPHWDYSVTRAADRSGKFLTQRFISFLSIDFCFAVSLMVILAFLFPNQKWRIWVCMIAAASPDLMWAYYRLYIEHIKKCLPRFGTLARLHTFVQWSQTPAGFITEIIWFLVTGYIILQFR